MRAQIYSHDSEDFVATESLYVAAESIWLKYRCGQNRDHAWGFKVHAMPSRWRVCNEAALVRSPFEFGWDLLQLLVEER